MKKLDDAAEIGLLETVLEGLFEGAPGTLFRVAIGFATVPALRGLLGKQKPDWALLPGVLTMLLLLRAVPAMIRKVIPFSQAVQIIWWNRRQLAKRYDSYQWRKLFWIGTGMAIYAASTADFSSSSILIFSFCILAGAAGLVRWRVIEAHLHESTPIRRKIIRTVL
jgi:hypothetical protein